MSRFSSVLLDHARSPRNGRAMDSADGVGKSSLEGRAPYITFFVRLRDDAENTCAEATFLAFGCGFTLACCSILTELVENRTVQEALRITAGDVNRALEGIPGDRRFCADLAVEAAHAAFHDGRKNKDRLRRERQLS